MKTKNGLIFELLQASECDEEWSEYDKKVAESHIKNYGWIYIDSFGFPIDNENDLEDIENFMNE